jgi:hypothetical protein
MLKQLAAWLLIFSVLTVNYSRLFVYAGFKLNQSYITAKLCENRDKPLLHCNGKCYLMKKIKQACSRMVVLSIISFTTAPYGAWGSKARSRP